MVTPQMVKDEVKQRIDELAMRGMAPQEIRNSIVESLSKTYDYTILITLPLARDLKYALLIADALLETLEIVNEVMVQHDLAPIHIKELENPLVIALETHFGSDIETIVRYFCRLGS